MSTCVQLRQRRNQILRSLLRPLPTLKCDRLKCRPGDSIRHHCNGPLCNCTRYIPRPTPIPFFAALLPSLAGSPMPFPPTPADPEDKLRVSIRILNTWANKRITSATATKTGKWWMFLLPWYRPQETNRSSDIFEPRLVFLRVTLSKHLVAIKFIIRNEAVLTVNRY